MRLHLLKEPSQTRRQIVDTPIVKIPGVEPLSRKAASAESPNTLMQRCVRSCVYLFERIMPDPFVIVILLTVVTALCAFFLAPKGAPSQILSGWYKGIIGIFTFAFQMVLILVTGHALANARIVKAGMQGMARLATGPCSAVAIVFAIGSAA